VVASYTIFDLVGRGGYGDIYAVRQTPTSPLLALKLEAHSAEKHALETELKFLKDIQDSPYFPHIIDSGSTSLYLYVVLELFGPSLSSMRREIPSRHYTVPTVVRLSIFMLECIRDFHEHGFVHRDIKPSNFLLRTGCKCPLVLIDFGLSRRYIDPETGAPVPERSSAGFRGTSKYASLTAHRLRDQGPRDDMVSWVYSLVEMLHGSLPWRTEGVENEVERLKSSTPAKILLWGLPPEFRAIWTYIASLEYLSKVDFDYVSALLRRALWNANGVKSPFDWEYESIEGEAVDDVVIPLPRAVDYVGAFGEGCVEEIEEIPEPNLCRYCEVA
jgi:serine/threonine protein kinase